MSNQYLKLRRSAVPGKVPGTSSLDFGEIALNTYDGQLFFKKSGSQGEIVTVVGSTGSFTGSFSGSLFGTASCAINAITASYALNAGTGNVSGSQYYVAVFSGSNSVRTGSIFDSGSFTAIGAIVTPHLNAPERLFVNASDTDSYNLISGHGTINSYLQLNIKNFSSGNTGSSDIVATADNGDESSFFINMGVNSSGYNNPNGIGQSNDAYLYSTAQDLLIGNASAGKRVIIFNGSGPALDNAKVYITSEGKVGINQLTPLFNLDVSGSGRYTNNLIVTGSITATTGITGSLEGTASWARNAITASYILNAVSASFASTASSAISSTNALTASSADNFIVRNSLTASSALINGTITAQTLVVQTVSSSIVYSSGSNIFGNSLTNTQVFTGSLFVTGSSVMSGSLSVTQGITGSLYGTASWAQNSISSSYPIAIFGTTIYSTGPSAGPAFSNDNSIFLGSETAYYASNASFSNFIGYQAGYSGSNANNSNFIGRRAGYRATNADYSIFIGNGAGSDAKNATTSIFIGETAGDSAVNVSSGVFIGQIAGSDATNASYSNFIGEAAGQLAKSASYSNFIGYNAGYRAFYASESILIGKWAGSTTAGNNGIGANNIVIGNNISLINDRRDSLNIGAIIFGTGSYSGGLIGSHPFTGTSNGRIGINQPYPTFSLDVSGSGRYTLGLTVTGSLIAPIITGSLFGTASFAQTASYILNAISSSYAFTASSAISSSQAQTASYVLNAVSSSFAATASWALNFITSSVTSASYAFTASSAVSSSFALTASYVANASSFPFTGSAVITGSLVVTGSTSLQVLNVGASQFNNTSSITVAGTTIVSSINTGSFTSAFYNYTVASGSNARSGQVMSVWNGSTVRYTEVTTMDIGNTATASFAVALSGNNVQLNLTAPGVWTVKSIANLI